MRRPNSDEIVYLWTQGNGVVAHMRPEVLRQSIDIPNSTARELVRLLENFEPGTGDSLLRRGALRSGPTIALTWLIGLSAQSGADTRIKQEFVPLLEQLFSWCHRHGSMAAMRPIDFVKYKRAANVLPKGGLVLAQYAQEIRDAHHQFLKSNPAFDSVEAQAGCLVVTLVLDNGVATMPLLRQALTAMVSPILATTQHHYLELLDIRKSETSDCYRRLFLAPLPAIVVMRNGKALHQLLGTRTRRWVRPLVSNNDLRRWARHYLSLLTSKRPELTSAKQKTLAALLKYARAMLRMTLPMYLASYAVGEIKSTSLPEARFRSLYDVKPRNPLALFYRLTSLIDTKADKQSVEQAHSEAKDAVRAVLAAKSPNDLNAALVHLTQSGTGGSSTPLQHLAGACLLIPDLCKKQSITRTVGRLRRILKHLGPGFVTALTALSKRTFIPKDIDDLEEVLISPLLHKPNASTLLKDLHFLLMAFATRVGLPTDNIRMIRIPRAGLYSPAEVRRAHALFDSPLQYSRSDRDRLNANAATEAWECNLRTSEGIFVDYVHVQDGEFTIRETVRRGLKNRSSARQVPFSFRVSGEPTSLNKLIELRAKEHSHARSSVGGVDSPFLFTAPPERFVEPWRVNRDVQYALSQVTGNKNARIYDLRHTWPNAALLGKEAEVHQLDQLKGHLGSFGEALDRYPLWAEHVFGPSKAIATYPYHCGQAMGHSRFKTTRENYLHLLDVLLLVMIKKYVTASPATLVGISGLKRRTAYRHLENDASMLVRAVEEANPRRVRRDDRPPSSPFIPAANDSDWFIQLDELYRCLSDTNADESGSQMASARWTVSQIQCAMQTLSELASQLSGQKGTQAKQHPMQILPNGQAIPEMIDSSMTHNGAIQACGVLSALMLKNQNDFKWALEKYARGAQRVHSKVSFDNIEDAERFRNIMQRACASIGGKFDIGSGNTKFGVGRRPLPTPGQKYWVSASPTGLADGPAYQKGWRWAWLMSICRSAF